jgi:hypothetical protein
LLSLSGKSQTNSVTVSSLVYDEIDDAPDNASDLEQEDPPDPRDASNIDPGEKGGDDGSEQGEIGPFAMV